MSFSSVYFLAFFFSVALAYYALPASFRKYLLLAAGCVFYMSFYPAYIFLIAGFVVVNFAAGRKLLDLKAANRKAVFYAAILTDLLILGLFKYLNFLGAGLSQLAGLFQWNLSFSALNILAPVGLSFQVFQALAYLIEVYRSNFKEKTPIADLALYFLFFPIVISGPIERPKNLLPQFNQNHAFDYYQVTTGLKWIAWGLFKKMVIADRLSLLVDPIYAAPQNYSGVLLLLATLAYAFQIYYDFSGYTDIARGTARILGFNLSLNFDRPYFAVSIADFWRRWHISLSNWLRDYIYYPLLRVKFLRKFAWRLQVAFLITFLISGIWHGAAKHFIVWGLLHGIFLAVSVWTDKPLDALEVYFSKFHAAQVFRLLRVAGTFALVCLAWIFFRANDVSDSLAIIAKLLQPANLKDLAQLPAILGTTLGNNYPVKLLQPNLSGFSIGAILLFQIMLAELIQYILTREDLSRRFARLPGLLRWACYYGLIFMILSFGTADISKFIYFQF